MTITTICRVSLIDFYLLSSIYLSSISHKFQGRILPHTNTVILLKLYCGAITEPGQTQKLRAVTSLNETHRKHLFPDFARTGGQESVLACLSMVYYARNP